MKSKHININDSLYKFLEQIKEDSPIAALLASQNIDTSKLVENHIDFLDVSHDDPYKISYLTSDRLSKIQENDDDVWTSSSRYHTKYGSFVNKIFNCFDNREVEKFSNLLRSIVGQRDLQLKVVSGEDIAKYYHYSSYSEQCGTLGQSCMKHDGYDKFLKIYTENTDVVKMLVALDGDDKLIGRALLWEFESHKIMDRIYTVNDESWSYYLKQWANKNNYLYKAKQNWNWTYHFKSNGKKVRQKLSVKLNNFDVDYYPYVDTFKWINIDTGELFNYKPKDETDVKLLISTDGGSNRNPNYLSIDSMTDAYENGELLKYIRYKSKDGEEFKTTEEHLYWSNINDCYIFCDDSEYVQQFNDYIFNKNHEQYNDRDEISRRLDAIKNRDIVVKEEFSKVENKVMTEEEIVNIFNNSYQYIHDRCDIVSIMTDYLEERTEEIAQEEQRRNSENTPTTTQRRSRRRTAEWLGTISQHLSSDSTEPISTTEPEEVSAEAESE